MGKTSKHNDQKAGDPLDPLFWSEAWEKATRSSSLSRRNVSPDRWMTFWSQISKAYGARIRFESQLIEEIVRMLILEGLLTVESVVLDIGCGPGTFAIPFARCVHHVVALDPAEKMIDALKEEAQRHGLSNITLLCQRWEESIFSKEFDLVFASFSPSIRNSANLLKMHEASRKYCCLITASDEKNFQVRNQLWESIFGEPFHSTSFHILYPFNYLYSCGFRPQVRFVANEVSYEEPVTVLIERYEEYFRMFTELTTLQKEKIRQYFERNAQNGIVKTCEERALAIMWWGVGE